MMLKSRPVLSAFTTRIRRPQRAPMSTVTPNFSPGADTAALNPALEKLVSRPEAPWRLTPSGEGVERSFRFKTFAKTWDFMTAVSLQCKLKNHHPEWSNVYNTTFVRWTTHNPKGLSDKDIAMAALCDELAGAFGEQPAESQGSSEGADLVGCAVGAAGDCCGPKKK